MRRSRASSVSCRPRSAHERSRSWRSSRRSRRSICALARGDALADVARRSGGDRRRGWPARRAPSAARPGGRGADRPRARPPPRPSSSRARTPAARPSALKTLGLAALLHQCGLRPPARDAELPVFDEVLADIGDEQSIAMSLSTFSGHVRTSSRSSSARPTGRSCCSTRLRPGPIPSRERRSRRRCSQRLADQARLTVATSHYPELKEWASSADSAANAATGFDPATEEPLFRVALGRPGTSHALRIAGPPRPGRRAGRAGERSDRPGAAPRRGAPRRGRDGRGAGGGRARARGVRSSGRRRRRDATQRPGSPSSRQRSSGCAPPRATSASVRSRTRSAS